jgi:hypothetical protein
MRPVAFGEALPAGTRILPLQCTKSEAGIAALGAPPDDSQGAGEANS